MKLTDEQMAGVTHTKGHAIVRAVAGSGKSEMLVHRIQFLMHQGVPASAILCLMFNTEAAEQFRVRLKELLPDVQDLPVVATFHAFAYQQLGHPNLTDEDELLQLLQRCIYKENQRRITRGEDLLGTSPYAVAQVYQQLDFIRNTAGDPPSEYAELLKDFTQQKKRTHASDFTDLMLNIVQQWKTQAPPHFTEILVDEYQDVNHVQQMMLESLLYYDTNLMVVGDEDQCIYEWRGSDPGLMVHAFAEKFNPTSYLLSNTFRYGHAIALMSNHLLQHNGQRLKKQVVSAKATPTTAEWVSGDLTNVVNCITDPDNTAILLRTYQRTAELELALRLKGVPYRLIGHTTLNESVLARFLTATLEGKAFDLDVWLLFFGENVPDWLIQGLNSEKDPVLGLGVVRRDARVGGHWKTKVEEAYHVVRTLYSKADWEVHDTLKVLKGFTHNKSLTRFLTFLENHPDLHSREQLLTLLAAPASEQGVVICSMHRAKGGGWKTVILPWLDADTFPSKRSDRESERRLAYVAFTRVKDRLICHSETEWHPSEGLPPKEVSPFITEVEWSASTAWASWWHQQAKTEPQRQTGPVRAYAQAIGVKFSSLAALSALKGLMRN